MVLCFFNNTSVDDVSFVEDGVSFADDGVSFVEDGVIFVNDVSTDGVENFVNVLGGVVNVESVVVVVVVFLDGLGGVLAVVCVTVDAIVNVVGVVLEIDVSIVVECRGGGTGCCLVVVATFLKLSTTTLLLLEAENWLSCVSVVVDVANGVLNVEDDDVNSVADDVNIVEEVDVICVVIAFDVAVVVTSIVLFIVEVVEVKLWGFHGFLFIGTGGCSSKISDSSDSSI